MDRLVLPDGSEAIYNKVVRSYETLYKYNNEDVTVGLVPFTGNDDTLEALKYEYSKLFKNIDEYVNNALDLICKKVCPILDTYDEDGKKMDPDMLRRSLTLIHIGIVDRARIGVIAPVYPHVAIFFEDNLPSEKGDSEPWHLMVSGTLEEGLEDVSIDGRPVSTLPFQQPYELISGDTADYDPISGTYSAEVMMLGDNVECFFEMDGNNLGCDKAVALFDKVYNNIERLDDEARKLFETKLPPKLDEIRKQLDDDEITVEQIMDDLFLDCVVCGPHDDVDLTYTLDEGDVEMHINAMGIYSIGLTRFSIEFAKTDLFD